MESVVTDGTVTSVVGLGMVTNTMEGRAMEEQASRSGGHTTIERTARAELQQGARTQVQDLWRGTHLGEVAQYQGTCIEPQTADRDRPPSS